jgi:hypothetical protein
MVDMPLNDDCDEPEPMPMSPPNVGEPEPNNNTGMIDDENKSLRRSTRNRRNKHEESLNEEKAPITSKWEPIKPLDAANVAPRKPPRKGKTCRATRNVVLKKTGPDDRKKRKRGEQDGPAKPEVVAVIEHHLTEDVVTHKYSGIHKSSNLTPAFQVRFAKNYFS